MNELIEKLLKPVSDGQPCGPDLSNDGAFDQIETILKGKPEVEIGTVQRPAEPPDWRELMEASAEFLGKSKHIRVAVILCCSQLKTSGLPGFRDGLELIRGFLEQYWAALYPQLDPQDGNDPTQRLNILGALTRQRGSVIGSWLAVVDGLYAAPVCQAKGAPAITFDQLLATKAKPGEGEAAAPTDGPSAAAVAGIIRAAGNEQITAQCETLKQSLAALQGIDQFLTTTLGAGNTISFETLERVLQEMLLALGSYVSGDGGSAAQAPEAVGEGAVASAVAGAINVRGAIRSREDVVRAIDTICSYYEQVEPSSPVPYVLRRAQKLAQMNFIEAVQELNLATTDSLRPSMGSGIPAEPAPVSTTTS
jgi:type VI secretion system protein ImpA